MRRPDINNFIAVTPPANERDFSFLAPCPASGLIVQGGRDEITTPSTVETMARRLNNQRHVEIDFAMIEDGDHMYNNHLKDLYKVSGQYVISAMQRRAPLKKRRGRRKKSELEDDYLLDSGVNDEQEYIDDVENGDEE
jgi:alpha/beta superfamily hydrolase